MDPTVPESDLFILQGFASKNSAFLFKKTNAFLT